MGFFTLDKKDMMYGFILILVIIAVYYAGGINNMLLLQNAQQSCPNIIDINSLTNTVVYNTSTHVLPIP